MENSIKQSKRNGSKITNFQVSLFVLLIVIVTSGYTFFIDRRIETVEVNLSNSATELKAINILSRRYLNNYINLASGLTKLMPKTAYTKHYDRIPFIIDSLYLQLDSLQLKQNNFLTPTTPLDSTELRDSSLYKIPSSTIANKASIFIPKNIDTRKWSSKVFAKGYHLKPLSEVQQFVLVHKRLPGVQASDYEIIVNGEDVARANSKLLEKIEELTLYVVELQKENQRQQHRLDVMEATQKALIKRQAKMYESRQDSMQ